MDLLSLIPERQERDVSVAQALSCGVSRLLADMGYRPLCEVKVQPKRRADIVGLGRAGEVVIVEIKSGAQDFLSDTKWPDYLPCCDQFYFGVGMDFDVSMLPDGVGIVMADKFGAEIVRPAPHQRMHASTRRAVVLRYARTAAARLHYADSQADS